MEHPKRGQLDFASEYVGENSEEGICALWCKMYIHNHFPKHEAKLIFDLLPMNSAISLFLDLGVPKSDWEN